MSGNDFSRCEQCGAVWLDEPKPCDCKTVEDVLREALENCYAIACNPEYADPRDAYLDCAVIKDIARQALKETA